MLSPLPPFTPTPYWHVSSNFLLMLGFHSKLALLANAHQQMDPVKERVSGKPGLGVNNSSLWPTALNCLENWTPGIHWQKQASYGHVSFHLWPKTKDDDEHRLAVRICLLTRYFKSKLSICFLLVNLPSPFTSNSMTLWPRARRTLHLYSAGHNCSTRKACAEVHRK